MVNLLREECSKPGLKSWVGINTEIEIKKLNASLLKFGCSSMCFWQLVNPVFADYLLGLSVTMVGQLGINTQIEVEKLEISLLTFWHSTMWNWFVCGEVYHGWKSIFDKIGVTLQGGLLEDSKANHFFMAMQFRGNLAKFHCWKEMACSK